MKHMSAIIAEQRLYGNDNNQQLAMEGIFDTIGDKIKDFKKKLSFKSSEDLKEGLKDRQAVAMEMSKALKAIRAEVARANFKETIKPVAFGSRLLTLGISSTSPEEVVRDLQHLRVDVKKMLSDGSNGKEVKRPQPAKRDSIPPMKFTKQEILQIFDAAIGMCDDYAAATTAAEADKIAKAYEDKKGAVATEDFFGALGDAFMSALTVVAQLIFIFFMICLALVAPLHFLLGLMIIGLISRAWKAMNDDD